MNQNDQLPDDEPPEMESLFAFVIVGAGVVGALFCVIAYLAVA